MSSVKGGNLQKGTFILFKNEPYEVTKAEFYAPGKGSAICRTKLKSVKNANTVEFTFKSNETVEELDVMAREMQFSYLDGDDVVFMDPRTYDQVNVDRKLLEDKVGYLIPELMMYLVFLDEKVIGVRFPQKVTLKVTHAEEAVAGDTINAPKKPVTVETGITVHVPLFIKTGESVIIDTTTGEYVGRAN
jgi:elongation factor P